jgi:Exo-beta-D-glucosaminidase Ig-fold domain
VVWQVYDWFLQTNAGYYFMQNACEPVHIQLNLNNLDVLVINRTYQTVPDLVAQVDIFTLDSKSLFHQEKGVSLMATDVQKTISLSKVLKGVQGVSFVVLNLKNLAGKIVSHNVYWLSKDEDFTSLNNMAGTSVKVDILKEGKSKIESSWTIQITNSSDRIAFFIRPQILTGGDEVLPSYWSASYFTLSPDESKTLTVSCPVVKIGTASPVLKVSGWNVAAQELNLSR